MATNEMWSCDKGRFGFGHLTDESRLTFESEIAERLQYYLPWNAPLLALALHTLAAFWIVSTALSTISSDNTTSTLTFGRKSTTYSAPR